MRNMKITMICDVLGEPNNGTSLAAWNLIRFLTGQGHELTVAAPAGENDAAVTLPIPVLKLGRPLDHVLERNGVKLAKPDSALLEEAVRQADVVHLLLPFPLSVKALKIARKYDKPVTASFHCQAENFTAHLGMMDFSPMNRLTYKTFYRLVYRYCDAVHYPTEFIRQVFEEQTGKTNAYVISNGVNDAFVKPEKEPENDKFVILCCGRYSREKAQQQLIEAVGRSKYREKIRVIFAGDGPRREKLMRLARIRGVDCVFRFFSRPDLVHVMQTADLYVHTAVIEIEAIACMEAICCGLVPVICDSPRSATRFFARGANSLFAENDPADLAKKIEYWIEHPAGKKASAALYEPLRRSFSQRDCMERMEQMLKEAVENH